MLFRSPSLPRRKSRRALSIDRPLRLLGSRSVRLRPRSSCRAWFTMSGSLSCCAFWRILNLLSFTGWVNNKKNRIKMYHIKLFGCRCVDPIVVPSPPTSPSLIAIRCRRMNRSWRIFLCHTSTPSSPLVRCRSICSWVG